MYKDIEMEDDFDLLPNIRVQIKHKIKGIRKVIYK